MIEGLRRDIAALHKEVSSRDDAIGEKERRILDLKRKTQELEKFRFVLEYSACRGGARAHVASVWTLLLSGLCWGGRLASVLVLVLGFWLHARGQGAGAGCGQGGRAACLHVQCLWAGPLPDSLPAVLNLLSCAALLRCCAAEIGELRSQIDPKDLELADMRERIQVAAFLPLSVCLGWAALRAARHMRLLRLG